MAEHESDLEFDDLVHQPTRLQLFAYLYRHDGTSFGQLSDDLDLTEGNLSSHLQRMEEAGAVDIEKEFVEGKNLERRLYSPATDENCWRRTSTYCKHLSMGWTSEQPRRCGYRAPPEALLAA